MTDKIIINTIFKIHFILISAIGFIFTILFTTFIVLQNGIYIDNISVSNIEVKKLYIKWDEKISIIAEELDIENNSKRDESKFNLKKIGKDIQQIILFDSIIKKILIKKISINDTVGSFKYSSRTKGFLNLNSKNFDLKSTLFFEKNLLVMQIETLVDKKRDISINGSVILNTGTKIEDAELVTSLKLLTKQGLEIDINAFSTENDLKYMLHSNSKIKDIKKIVDMIGSNLPAQFWYYEAIDMSNTTLDKAYGYLEYDKLEEAYKNIYVEATLNKLKYTYDKLLAPIDTSKTVIIFNKGKLNIYPKSATTYKASLDKSWLNIDFTKKQIPINLYLDFDAKLNDDLLGLLNYYGIDLPFKQTKGTLKTDLYLNINISTEEVMAKGKFFTKKGQIHYLGMDIDVFDTLVSLNGKKVKVKNMLAKYNDKHIQASSYLDIDFDAGKQEGILNFRLENAYLKDIDTKLSTKALHVEYIINPKQDYIIADKSQWKVKNNKVTIAKLNMPFYLKTSSLKINNAPFSVENIADGFMSGEIFLKPFKIGLDVDLMSLTYNNAKLDSTKLSLHLKYKNHLSAYSRSVFAIKINNTRLKLNDFNLNLKGDKLSMHNIGLHVDSLLSSKLSLNYNIKKSIGYADIHHIKIQNDSLGEIYNENNTSRLFIENNNDELSIISKKHDFKFTKNYKKWNIDFNKISKIAKNSNLLQKYNLIYGKCNITKKANNENIDIKVDTNYRYKLLVKDNKAIQDYEINAKYNTKNTNTSININDLVFVDIKKDININANDIGIDFKQLLNILSSSGSKKESKITKKIYFDMSDSYIYLSKDRHVISDSIKVKYIDDVLVAKLKYKKGKIRLSLKDDNIELFGKNLNDTFMNKLFALSKFKGGNLNFYIHGPKDAYSGSMHISDSTIKDYKILNNVLAFVNTIPSLFTFKVPGYNRKGLKIENAFFTFKFKDEIYNIEEFMMESKEIDILGEGTVSIANNTIDLDMNLKTDLGSSVSKIPIVGYILLGKENVSTSLKLKGKLNDPRVKTQVSRDIVTAPLNILKRTILLPMKLFSSSDENETK